MKPLTSHLQKCVFVHKWRWYTFVIEESHAIIMHLVHWLPNPASLYVPHSLDIVMHGVYGSCSLISWTPDILWNDSYLIYLTLYNTIICVASNGGRITWLVSAPVASHLWKSASVHVPYRTVAVDYHAFGAFAAHPSFIKHATFLFNTS